MTATVNSFAKSKFKLKVAKRSHSIILKLD